MKPRDPNHILIGIATGRGDTRWETSMALMQLLTTKSDYSFSLLPGGGCDVCHARNLMLHHFVHKTDAGRILFLDSDVVPTADDVLRLLAHKRDFIAGRYPLKGYKLRWSYNRPTEHESGLLNCFEVCTGFMCLSYDLVLGLMHFDNAFVIEDAAYRDEMGFEVMKMGVIEGRRFSEDFYLSRRIREETTVPLLVDPTIEVGHIGTLNLLTLFTGQKEGV